MKCVITEIHDTRSAFPFQAMFEVMGARPFEKLTGRVLNVPHAESAGEYKILLGAADRMQYLLLSGEWKIALRAYAVSLKEELEMEEIRLPS